MKVQDLQKEALLRFITLMEFVQQNKLYKYKL